MHHSTRQTSFVPLFGLWLTSNWESTITVRKCLSTLQFQSSEFDWKRLNQIFTTTTEELQNLNVVCIPRWGFLPSEYQQNLHLTFADVVTANLVTELALPGLEKRLQRFQKCPPFHGDDDNVSLGDETQQRCSSGIILTWNQYVMLDYERNISFRRLFLIDFLKQFEIKKNPMAIFVGIV